jgi:oligoribonuclease
MGRHAWEQSMSDVMVWIDLEMTGLDIDVCSIIEIATIITDGELNIIAEGPNLAINVDDELLDAMDEWNTTHHNRSGLVERVRRSKIDHAEAGRQTLAFIAEYVEEGVAPLCGNSVWNDRKFMEKEMHEVADYLHYRMVDVSTIKELANRWYPELEHYRKQGTHLALDDIRESVAELRYYRDQVFRD